MRDNIEKMSVNAIRVLAADAVQKANSGLPGLPLGSAAMAYELWANHMNHNPADPKWFNRDRFILSGGHGSTLLYSRDIHNRRESLTSAEISYHYNIDRIKHKLQYSGQHKRKCKRYKLVKQSTVTHVYLVFFIFIRHLNLISKLKAPLPCCLNGA